MSEVYAFIEAGRTTQHGALWCRLLKLARSSFYLRVTGRREGALGEEGRR
jgi:putative transposase